MRPRERSSTAASGSYWTTSKPPRAVLSAIPDPMKPAPMIATVPDMTASP